MVDLPALVVSDMSRQAPGLYDRVAYPLDPSKTKMPVLGMSRLRSSTAVTMFLRRPRRLVRKSFPKCLMEIATSGGIRGAFSPVDASVRFHGLLGFFASYSQRSSITAKHGQIRMSTYNKTLCQCSQ